MNYVQILWLFYLFCPKPKYFLIRAIWAICFLILFKTGIFSLFALYLQNFCLCQILISMSPYNVFWIIQICRFVLPILLTKNCIQIYTQTLSHTHIHTYIDFSKVSKNVQELLKRKDMQNMYFFLENTIAIIITNVTKRFFVDYQKLPFSESSTPRIQISNKTNIGQTAQQIMENNIAYYTIEIECQNISAVELTFVFRVTKIM